MDTGTCETSVRDIDKLVESVLYEHAKELCALSDSVVGSLLKKAKIEGIPMSVRQNEGVSGRNYYVAFSVLAYSLYRVINTSMVLYRREDV